MNHGTEQHLTHERLMPGVRVIRFIRPDLRRQLDPIVSDDNVLYREIAEALGDLATGDRVVMNFGLVERFPTAFFQLLMKVRQFVMGKKGQTTLCCFRPEILPAVELMGGSRLFGIATSEEAAIQEGMAKRSNHG